MTYCSPESLRLLNRPVPTFPWPLAFERQKCRLQKIIKNEIKNLSNRRRWFELIATSRRGEFLSSRSFAGALQACLKSLGGDGKEGGWQQKAAYKERKLAGYGPWVQALASFLDGKGGGGR